MAKRAKARGKTNDNPHSFIEEMREFFEQELPGRVGSYAGYPDLRKKAQKAARVARKKLQKAEGDAGDPFEVLRALEAHAELTEEGCRLLEHGKTLSYEHLERRCEIFERAARSSLGGFRYFDALTKHREEEIRSLTDGVFGSDSKRLEFVRRAAKVVGRVTLADAAWMKLTKEPGEGTLPDVAPGPETEPTQEGDEFDKATTNQRPELPPELRHYMDRLDELAKIAAEVGAGRKTIDELTKTQQALIAAHRDLTGENAASPERGVNADAERNLGISEAAEILGLSEVGVRQRAQRGLIGEKVAGRYLFSRQELEADRLRDRDKGGRPRNEDLEKSP